MSYAKLFASITESSLWSEPKEVRLLFVTMLARADAVGFVEASQPGLARVANLSADEVTSALEVLEGPDPHSKNPDNEGRRLLKVPGGWMLLNYEEYRNRRTDEERREYMRKYMQDYRRKQSVNTPVNSKHDVKPRKPRLAQAEAEAEAKPPPPTPSAKAADPEASGKEEGEAWKIVLGSLKALDVNDAAAAVRDARANLLTPREAMAIIAHFKACPGSWKPGGLHFRIRTGIPGMAANDGWPPPNPAPRVGPAERSQEDERGLLIRDAKNAKWDPEKINRALVAQGFDPL